MSRSRPGIMARIYGRVTAELCRAMSAYFCSGAPFHFEQPVPWRGIAAGAANRRKCTETASCRPAVAPLYPVFRALIEFKL